METMRGQEQVAGAATGQGVMDGVCITDYGFQLLSRPLQPLGWSQVFASLKQDILKY